jgi:nicotinamide-nucleotide adenylyltransferase
MTDLGVIHGRFQVIHNDHLKYILAGKSRCRHLVVGITNPDPVLTRDDPSDPLRSLPAANPLNYFERYTMVRVALLEAGVPESEISIVPVPINVPELYGHYLPMEGVFYLTIYDEWGRTKLNQFQTLGLKTEVLWEKPSAEKGLTGAEIRRRMAAGDPWESMVPNSTASLMKRWAIPERLKKPES